MSVKLCVSSREDLLAIPAVMMGFHPQDSLVLLGVRDARVVLCARLDLDWYRHTFATCGGQLLALLERVEGLVVIGYGRLAPATESIAELLDLLGDEVVLEALILDDRLCWEFGSGAAPEPFDYECSALAARAVFEGLYVARSRDEAVAATRRCEPPPEDLQRAVERELAELGPDARLALLADLATPSVGLEPDDALRLALLLLDEDCAAAVVTALNPDTAEAHWAALAAARRACPAQAEEVVLGALALASWLAGRAAAFTACIEQLVSANARHPVARLACQIYRAGEPPQALWA